MGLVAESVQVGIAKSNGDIPQGLQILILQLAYGIDETTATQNSLIRNINEAGVERGKILTGLVSEHNKIMKGEGLPCRHLFMAQLKREKEDKKYSREWTMRIVFAVVSFIFALVAVRYF